MYVTILTWVKWLTAACSRVICLMPLAGGNSDLGGDLCGFFKSGHVSLILRVTPLWEYLPLEHAAYILYWRAAIIFHRYELQVINMGKLPCLVLSLRIRHIFHMCKLRWNQVRGIANVLHGICVHVYMRFTFTVQLQPAAFQITTGLRYFVCKTKWYIWLWSRNSVSAKQTYMAFCSVDVLSILASWCRTWSPNSYTARPGIVVRPHFWGF